MPLTTDVEATGPARTSARRRVQILAAAAVQETGAAGNTRLRRGPAYPGDRAALDRADPGRRHDAGSRRPRQRQSDGQARPHAESGRTSASSHPTKISPDRGYTLRLSCLQPRQWPLAVRMGRIPNGCRGRAPPHWPSMPGEGSSGNETVCGHDMALMADVLARHGVDLLVNNAGIGFAASTRDTSMKQWDRTLAVDLPGTCTGGKCQRALSRRPSCEPRRRIFSGRSALLMTLPARPRGLCWMPSSPGTTRTA